MDPGAFLRELAACAGYEGQIAVHRRFPPRPARTARLRSPLPSPLEDALERAGLRDLFVHQAEAIDHLRSGRHTIVATGTASGKTLAYLVPVAEAVLEGGAALYLAPTKALAQDQRRQVEILGLDALRAETYDGDTPAGERAAIRRRANFVLTNPDMLHRALLPHHRLWRAFFARLAFVVVDEAHVLRGVFGSHVALVLRRLRRVARAWGSDPVFAFASATIGNPAQHASALAGVDVVAVTEDGSPSGERHVVFWNPPLLADGRRRSSNLEAAHLVSELARRGGCVLAFSKSRVAAELVARYARSALGEEGPAVVAYRAGYLARERREIERGLLEGRYPAVSATNALELGIDVGGLDAVVLNGFPGTVASARQQAGRAGRSGRPALAVVVPADEPLDQYYVAHPNDFFAKPHEAALVNPYNPEILASHLGCAAYEVPLEDEADAAIFGPSCVEVSVALEEAGHLVRRRGRRYWARGRPPALAVDIRAVGAAPWRIVEEGTGRLVGTTDAARAPTTVHPGAIYLHQDETYRVTSLHATDNVALVRPETAHEYTQARTEIDVAVLACDASEPMGGGTLWRGLVEVTERVIGYQRKKIGSGEVLEVCELDLPPQRLVTRAVWYALGALELAQALGPLRSELLGALHAAEHAAIGLLPVFAMCDRGDLGGLSTNHHEAVGGPAIFIYDAYPMGVGITDHACAVAREHLAATREHVAACPCPAGCPACIQSPKCGNWNEPLHKEGAIRVLDLLLGAPPFGGAVN